MIKEGNKEIYNAIIAFLKSFIKMGSKDVIICKLPLILEAIFNWDKSSQVSLKGKVRNLMIKIMRRVDSAELEELVPEEHKSLIKYLEKAEKRNQSKRKKLSDEIGIEEYIEDIKLKKTKSRRKNV